MRQVQSGPARRERPGGGRIGWLPLSVPSLLIALVVGASAAAPPADGPAAVEVFTRAGCPRCEAAGRFLARLQAEQPGLRIAYRHVDLDPEALERLRGLSAEAGVVTPGLPAFQVGRHLVIGFADEATTGERLRAIPSSWRAAS